MVRDKVISEAQMRRDERVGQPEPEPGPRSYAGRNQVVVSPDYPQPIESVATTLPAAAKKMYGCANCEWRDSALCPFGYSAKPGAVKRKNTHGNGICQDRLNWLLSFSTGDVLRPTFAQWQLEFNKGIAQVQLHKEYFKLAQIESQLSIAEADGDRFTPGYKSLDVLRRATRSDWFNLWKELAKIGDAMVGRETPKKIEVEVKQRLGLDDLHSLMGGEVINVTPGGKKDEEKE